MHETILIIDDTAQIIIPHNAPYKLDCSYEDSIILKNRNNKIILAQGFIYHNTQELISLLEKALLGKLILHKSITKDLGYLFNEYSAMICEEKTSSACLRYIQKNNDLYWPGIDYSLWSYNFASWIYNKKDLIIFEVTPFYPYMYCEPAQEPNYISYEEWIKTYRPYFITTIPIKTALQWIMQAKQIIKIIDNN